MNLLAWLTGGGHTSDPFDFPGGVLPPANKSLSLERPLSDMPLCQSYCLPLDQHSGHPALPVVTIGESVSRGQLVAEPGGLISAAVHAPVSGTVVAIEDRTVAHPSGLPAKCLVLASDGHDRVRDNEPWPDFARRRPMDLLDRIRNAGLAGLGGACFPTAIKLSTDHQRLHTLIVNGAECEPYITADQTLMTVSPERILEGVRVADTLYGFDRILIGIEDDKPDAIRALRNDIPGDLDDRLDIVSFPARYPSGGEKQLIQRLTGQEVPSGGLPPDLGMLCLNVGTLAALADAVVRDTPLIERIVTVTGRGVVHPGNYRVRLGTSVRALLAHCGVDVEGGMPDRVIQGGPMMGFELPGVDVPVTKSTNCLIVPGADELPAPPDELPCIRCGQCEQACPAGLLPQQLYWFTQAREWDKAEDHHLFDCIECGACAYVCPSHIPLVQYYRHAKGEIRREQRAHEQAEIARQRFEARQVRLAREDAEKEARRRRRAENARARREEKQQEHRPDRPDAASGDNATERLRQALEKAETKLADAEGQDRKAMQMTVNKLREKLQKMENADASDGETP